MIPHYSMMKLLQRAGYRLSAQEELPFKVVTLGHLRERSAAQL